MCVRLEPRIRYRNLRQWFRCQRFRVNFLKANNDDNTSEIPTEKSNQSVNRCLKKRREIMYYGEQCTSETNTSYFWKNQFQGPLKRCDYKYHIYVQQHAFGS